MTEIHNKELQAMILLFYSSKLLMIEIIRFWELAFSLLHLLQVMQSYLLIKDHFFLNFLIDSTDLLIHIPIKPLLSHWFPIQIKSIFFPFWQVSLNRLLLILKITNPIFFCFQLCGMCGYLFADLFVSFFVQGHKLLKLLFFLSYTYY